MQKSAMRVRGVRVRVRARAVVQRLEPPGFVRALDERHEAAAGDAWVRQRAAHARDGVRRDARVGVQKQQRAVVRGGRAQAPRAARRDSLRARVHLRRLAARARAWARAWA
jgi:hypothetical protein